MPTQKDPTYRSWIKMRIRCRNPANQDYKYYGGRGIKVCPQWDDFWQFVADMGTRPAGMSLDRINPDGDYEPGNCRWATLPQQNRNKRSVRKFLLNGQEFIAKELAAICKVDRKMIYRWSRRGMTAEQICAKYGVSA